MKLPLNEFFMQTSRTHASMARETDLTRHKIETWMTDGKPIFVHFDADSEVIHRIVEEPVSKTHYKRRLNNER